MAANSKEYGVKMHSFTKEPVSFGLDRLCHSGHAVAYIFTQAHVSQTAETFDGPCRQAFEWIAVTSVSDSIILTGHRFHLFFIICNHPIT